MASPADISGLQRQSLLRLIGALGVSGMATGTQSLAHADALLQEASMKKPAAGSTATAPPATPSMQNDNHGIDSNKRHD